MRLIKQCALYFKEGNSDKVYEVDLCEVGNDQYVVNFRYGRRGSALKEGSKTPVPVSLTEAEKIYAAVADEKISKGYTTSESSQPPTPRAAAFSLATASPVIAADWMSLPKGPVKAILERLHDAAQGGPGSRRSSWKLTRVIWKAGQYRIREAAPYILSLFSKGDTLHQYVCTWVLVRTGHPAAVEALSAIYKDHPSPLVVRLAGAGLLTMLSGEAQAQHAVHYLQALPEAIQQGVAGNEPAALEALLQEQLQATATSHNWIEPLYLLAVERRWLRPVVKQVLLQLPFQPNYFKPLRAVYKLAELLDDFEVSGLLACRIEREGAFFDHQVPLKDTTTKVDLPALDEDVNPHKELRKKNSRLAYSQRTRWYLHRRVRRRLQLLGESSNTDYVKLATSLLINYKHAKDFKEPYSVNEYKWIGRSYANVETRYPQNAQAVFMHQILSGEHPDLELVAGKHWRIRSNTAQRSGSRSSASGNQLASGGILKKLIGLFNKKKERYQPIPAPVPAPAASTPNENGTPYLHLWNQLPQSYVQLLIEAELEEIHEFAIGGLTTHPSYASLKEKLDKEVYKKLLSSPFPIPGEWGYTLATERYAVQEPEADLITAMLNSNYAKAREKGKEWTVTNQYKLLQRPDFAADLVFVRDPAIRAWAQELIRNQSLSGELKKAVVGKSLAAILAITTMSAENESLIKGAGENLFALFGPELREVPLDIVAELLLHPVPPVLLFGLQLLPINQHPITAETLNRSLLTGLLHHSYAPVRTAGISLLGNIDATLLLPYTDELIAACLSDYRDVRQNIPPVLARVAQQEKTFGYKATDLLMPYLLRKETSEGLHEDVSRLLCQELSDYLQNAHKETALHLLYGNYAAAQNVGVVILEKYTQPDQLTMPQVIALGSHENYTVRAWCWRFYREQAARIRYEKEAATRLLESKWPDTRAFAMQYFREGFTEADWSPELLITLADSVKPDVEAYGRELITRHFESAQGTQYLLQLSQHPSEKMQLFATNYLEQYAADDVTKIASLEFYFRSVLTRVNKSRVAKNRIYRFLLTEGRKSEEAAHLVSAILSDISATAAIGDKAKCIELLLQLKALYDVATPLTIKPIETRS